MADYNAANKALIDAIEMKAKELHAPDWPPHTSAPILLQLAQAYAAVREASK